MMDRPGGPPMAIVVRAHVITGDTAGRHAGEDRTQTANQRPIRALVRRSRRRCWIALPFPPPPSSPMLPNSRKKIGPLT